jgi:hypothetical protein
MPTKIPSTVMTICSEIISDRETHDSLNSLFIYAGASGDIPDASKKVKALQWMRNTNNDPKAEPLTFLGKVLENYMEEPLNLSDKFDAEKMVLRQKINLALNQHDLRYVKGGIISGNVTTPSRNLHTLIKNFDTDALEMEFERAIENVDKDPREAISAASNIIESICKIYITQENLIPPPKQDLKSVWSVVRKHLGFDPQQLEEKDLQLILSGLISITEGIGALRTHASSAHGSNKKAYKIEPRHARLAIHSAHTISVFILETWQKKSNSSFYSS